MRTARTVGEDGCVGKKRISEGPGGAGRQGREHEYGEEAVGGFTEGEKIQPPMPRLRPVAPRTGAKTSAGREGVWTAPDDGERGGGRPGEGGCTRPRRPPKSRPRRRERPLRMI